MGGMTKAQKRDFKHYLHREHNKRGGYWGVLRAYLLATWYVVIDQLIREEYWRRASEKKE